MRLQKSCLLRTSSAAACHGMMLIPRPLRTIALMISTFSVSITICGSMRSRVKNSSASRLVIEPVSNRTNGCLSRSDGRIGFRFASGCAG